jgi:hypothetical protein
MDCIESARRRQACNTRLICCVLTAGANDGEVVDWWIYFPHTLVLASPQHVCLVDATCVGQRGAWSIVLTSRHSRTFKLLSETSTKASTFSFLLRGLRRFIPLPCILFALATAQANLRKLAGVGGVRATNKRPDHVDSENRYPRWECWSNQMCIEGICRGSPAPGLWTCRNEYHPSS